jgi:hypothetical protein
MLVLALQATAGLKALEIIHYRCTAGGQDVQPVYVTALSP